MLSSSVSTDKESIADSDEEMGSDHDSGTDEIESDAAICILYVKCCKIFWGKYILQHFTEIYTRETHNKQRNVLPS